MRSRTGSDVASALSLLNNDYISHSVHLRELFTVKRRHQLPGSRLGGDEVLCHCHFGETADVTEREKRSGILVWRRSSPGAGNVGGNVWVREMGRQKGGRCLMFLPHNHFMALLQTQALHSEHHSL